MRNILVLFFTVSNSILSFCQNPIEGTWVNQNLFQVEINPKENNFTISTNQVYKGAVLGLNLVLLDSTSNGIYQFTINKITKDSILLSPQNISTDLIWGNQKFYKKSFLENQFEDFEKLTMIYQSHNSCPTCSEEIFEISNDGMFRIKFRSAGTGLIKVVEGKLHDLDLKTFKKLAQKSLIHKYPLFDLSNRFVFTDSDIYYFSIHVNGANRESGFQGIPPNSKELIYFLLNIGELAELKTIDENYLFEIR